MFAHLLYASEGQGFGFQSEFAEGGQSTSSRPRESLSPTLESRLCVPHAKPLSLVLWMHLWVSTDH